MALDFPAGASSGQTFSSNGVTWSFDGDKWKVSTGTGIEPVFISSSTPSGVDGQLYWDSDESTAYIYYNDGNTAQWVPLVSTAPVTFDATAIVSGTLPVARGGTGITTFDAGKIVEGNTEAEVVDTGSDGHFKVTTEGTERLRINNSGTIQLTAATNNSNQAIQFGDPDADNRCLIQYRHATDALHIYTAASERMVIDSSGRLLVGATSAAIGSRMDVHAGSDGENIFGITGADQSSEFLALGITSSQAILSAGNASSNGTSLVLKTADSVGSENERMRIDSSGNVGIGTSSPGTKLEVVGSNAANNLVVSAGNTDFAVYNNDSTGEARLVAEDGSTNNNSKFLTLYTQASGATNASERVRIGSAGQIGIAGANYGTSGQVLTSGGPSSAPSWADASSGASFVTGMIMMFTGSTAPSGWAFCDGNNGTPDLRDRFIVGTGSTYSSGDTGGSADAIIPTHTHNVSQSNHSHSITLRTTQTLGSPATGAQQTVNRTGTTINTSSASANITIDSAGESATGKNLPPYYALAFIMKT